LACVLWDGDCNRVDLHYADGRSDHLLGSETLAIGLAHIAGLQIMPTSGVATRWA
jgi:hypothetical protein